ncbi:guanylate kinase [Aquicella lusitana]|uniref:Guanylate kinase n=1 Tax=Aquicella lusitana TaxID=254246 RepID=A0A370GHW3_9COXI|nr:guanylate kinase [Aquicella lusitana]RDI41503.1 guanylate kinase [Aquicella lusitana]VVC72603.1 Guanylate kinase [Aquicella lusitana]
MADSGNLYVVAAPSGAGKTTLVKALVDSLPKITVSVSHTTRPQRPNEMHGVNYYFTDKAEFERMIQEDAFLEYATIFDHYYGTSKQWVQETLASGVDVVLEIDWQGHQQIKRLFPDAIGIFILPPSLEDLKDRLIKRNQDHPDIIKKRLADAKETVSHLQEFEYIVVNDDFVSALHDLKTIIEAGRLLQKRQQAKFAKLIKNLAVFNGA